jgi:hypothetical protein
MIEPLSGRHVRTVTAVETRDVAGKRLFQKLKATFSVRKIQPSSILNPTIPVQPILAPKSDDRRLAERPGGRGRRSGEAEGENWYSPT